MDSIRRSIFAGVATRAVTIATLLATPPLFLFYGDAQFLGRWLLLIAIPSTLNLFDFGVPHIAGSYMAISHAQARYADYARVFWTALTFTICIFPILLLGFWAFSSFIRSLANAQGDEHSVLVLLALFIIETQLLATIYGALRGRGEVVSAYAYETTVRLFEFVAVAVALYFGADLGKCVLALVVARAISLAVISVRLSSGPRGKQLLSGGPRWQTFLMIIGPSLTYGLSGASRLGYLQIPILIIGTTVGAAAAATYTALRTMARMGPQIILPIFDPIRSQISAAYSQGDWNRLGLLYQRSLQALVWANILVAMILALLGKLIFTTWTLGKLGFDAQLFYVLLVSGTLYGISELSLLVLASLARHQLYSVLAFAALAVAMGLYFVFPDGGLRTMAVLLAAYDLVIAVVGIMIAARATRTGIPALLWASVIPPFWLISEIWTVAIRASQVILVRSSRPPRKT